jgi:hypothetical protein
VTAAKGRGGGATRIVLLTLAAGQFVMALDTTVMNTAIATGAKDLGTIARQAAWTAPWLLRIHWLTHCP